LTPEAIAEMVRMMLDWIGKAKPFGIVHKTAPVNYGGEPGLLVWDFIIWNELTFVDAKTKTKQSLFNNFSDKETKKEFDRIVEEYGI